jgi:hypothetical protein
MMRLVTLGCRCLPLVGVPPGRIGGIQVPLFQGPARAFPRHAPKGLRQRSVPFLDQSAAGGLESMAGHIFAKPTRLLRAMVLWEVDSDGTINSVMA